MLTGSATNSLVIAFGNADGTFRSATTTVPTSFPSTDSIYGHLLDIDGDGLVDLVVGDSDADSCQVLWNDGSGTFTPADASVPCPSYAGDFDGDGISDMLVNGTMSYILFGDGSRGFGRRLDLPSAAFVAVDVNNDGALDLVFTAQQPPSGSPAVTYVYISTALTPAPASPDIQCDATMLGSLCTAASRI